MEANGRIFSRERLEGTGQCLITDDLRCEDYRNNLNKRAGSHKHRYDPSFSLELLSKPCQVWALAGPRRASGFGRRRRSARATPTRLPRWGPRRRETARASYSLGAAASTDACGRHMPGAPMRRACRWTTWITQAELAAMNRRARFPASPCGGTLRIAPAAEPARPALHWGHDPRFEDSRIRGFEDQGFTISDQ